MIAPNYSWVRYTFQLFLDTRDSGRAELTVVSFLRCCPHHRAAVAVTLYNDFVSRNYRCNKLTVALHAAVHWLKYIHSLCMSSLTEYNGTNHTTTNDDCVR